MFADRYGLSLSTTSPRAHAAYLEAVDLLLSANAGAQAAFQRATEADPSFALAHAGLARAMQTGAQADQASAVAGRARELAAALPLRERRHVEMLALLVRGQGAGALAVAREHLAECPRDAMVLAPCTGVFGLIGFSGRAGREQELCALLDGLAPAYGDDWWFLGAHGFALCETARLGEARRALQRALEGNPRNANGAHYFSHLLYEEGANAQGLAYLREWLATYPREAPLHCHLSWHVALWLLERGDGAAAWRVYLDQVAPGGSWGPPVNTLTDSASFLWRAELAGWPRDSAHWHSVRDYARQNFPRAGVSFADVHAALTFAAAGDELSLARLTQSLHELEQSGRLPAGPIVAALANAFGACVRSDWTAAIGLLAPVLGEHERIGGSRAQRDLVEYTLLKAYLASGHTPQAQQLLSRCRNRGVDAPVVAGDSRGPAQH